MKTRITSEDFNVMTWGRLDDLIVKIADQVKLFCASEGIHVDYMLPVLRGGGIPAIMLSYKLGIRKFQAIQTEHDYSAHMVVESLNSLEALHDKTRDYVILLVDCYHATGRTAESMYDRIKSILPRARVIYAVVGRDLMHLEDNREFLYSCCGFVSNECGIVAKVRRCYAHTLNKITLFPWENLPEEVTKMNEELENEGI